MKIKPNKLYLDGNGNVWKITHFSRYVNNENCYDGELEVYVKDPMAKTIGWTREFSINGEVIDRLAGKLDLVKEISIEKDPEYFI